MSPGANPESENQASESEFSPIFTLTKGRVSNDLFSNHARYVLYFPTPTIIHYVLAHDMPAINGIKNSPERKEFSERVKT